MLWPTSDEWPPFEEEVKEEPSAEIELSEVDGGKGLVPPLVPPGTTLGATEEDTSSETVAREAMRPPSRSDVERG